MSITCQLCSKPIDDGAEALRQSSRYVTLGSQDEQPHPKIPDTYHCTACTTSNAEGQHLRIVSSGTDFSTVSVLLIQPDGTEIPIIDSIKSMALTVNDQEFNSATITFERVEYDLVGTNHGADLLTTAPRDAAQARVASRTTPAPLSDR